MRKSGSERKMTLSSKKSLDPGMLLCTCDHTYIAGFSDTQVPSFDIDDVPVKLDHVVVIVQVDVDLLYFTVKTSELPDETQGGEYEKTGFAHQHEGCHNEMDRKKKDHGKDVFEYPVFEPSETQSLGEENMLEVSHVPGREEKEFVIHFEEVVFPGFWCRTFCNLFEYFFYFGCTVDLGYDIEGTCRVQYEDGQGFKVVQLFEHPPDRSVTTVDDNVTVLLYVVMFTECRGIDRSDIQPVIVECFTDGQDLQSLLLCSGQLRKSLPFSVFGYNYNHEN